jgi:large subunit ribosomal protein L21
MATEISNTIMKKDFAIINIKNSQEKVSLGTELEVLKLDGKEKDKLEFSDVLLVSKAGKVSIGSPNVAGAKVSAEIIEQAKGKKIHTKTYKAKSHQRRKVGTRPQLTRIRITKI